MNEQAKPEASVEMRERLSAKEWLNLPENDIGFEAHRFDSNGPICGNGIVVPGCERCAVEIALEAYHVYRQAGAASQGSGPLCDNCGKPSRKHLCWHHDENTFHPSESRALPSAPPKEA